MKESAVEAYLRKRVKELGGFHRKVIYQGRKGAPDDWCFFPGGKLLIVECKRPGKNHLDPLQVVEVDILQRAGFKATWVNDIEGVDRVLMEFFSES
mgnify:CR=1 FL=1